MERIEIFAELMDCLFSFSQVSGINQNIPRTYGSDEVLYMAEVHMIRDIKNHDGITITQLARMNGKSKSAVSQMIDKLQQKGLVIKEKHPESNRKVAIYLSEKGERINKYHTRFDRKEYDKVLSHLTDYTNEDFQKIIRLLHIVNQGSEKAIRLKKRMEKEPAEERPEQ